jgi:hypothetical protein
MLADKNIPKVMNSMQYRFFQRDKKQKKSVIKRTVPKQNFMIKIVQEKETCAD